MQKRDEVNLSISIFVKLSKKVITLSSLQRVQNKSNDIVKGCAQSFVQK
jgi:hypothetical protein